MAEVQCVIEIEALMPELNALGIDFREIHGQTIWPWMNSDGNIDHSVIYLGKIGSSTSDESKWQIVHFNWKMDFQILKKAIFALAPVIIATL